MATPSDFVLETVPPGSLEDRAPPKNTKSQIYRDIKVFKVVDDFAFKVSRRNFASFRDLVYNLCYKKNFNELERARAIFRWMTCRDLQKISFSDGVPTNSPEQLLTAFKAGKTTYARIFECLARHSGLLCVTVSGWAKGVDYRPGVAITSRPINHSWNAVRIDNNWQLVDCHWATRFLQSEENVPGNLVYEYDDFYFIPDPAELGYTHRPEELAWQLVEPTITPAVFEDYPLVKSYFFATGMLLIPDNNHGVVKTEKGVVALSIGFTGKMSFTFKLGHGDAMEETYKGNELSRCVVQETKDDRVVFYLRLHDKGDYYIIVFAHVVNDQFSAGESVFKAVCEYKIECSEGAPKDRTLFPNCSDSSWGPDQFANTFGLIPKKAAAIQLAENGHTEIPFEKTGNVRLYARLVKDGVEDAKLKHAVHIKNEGNTTTVVADLPEKGEYGLEVFANNPEKDGDMFTHVCQYLVAYTPGKTIESDYGHVSEQPPLRRPGTATGKAGKGKGKGRGVDADVDELTYKAFTDTPDDGDANKAYYPFGKAVETSDKKPSKLSKLKTIDFGQSIDAESEYVPQDIEIYNLEVAEEAPANFQIPDKKVELPSSPEAPLSTAKKLFKDVSEFNVVDTHAMNVSKSDHASFRDILWHLIYARNITNELDKARAIFLWLCSKDLTKLNFTNVEKGSPEEVLMNLQRGQTTYARVYETLCSYAGLRCKTLTGYAKGAEYKPGGKFSGTQGQHSWNAVEINGSWQLVDCHWAARRVVGKKEITSDNVRYELDEYYFMPAPAQLIYTHFPEDASWQLLEERLTLDDFENLVPVKPAFFKNGLTLESHMEAIVHSSSDVPVTILLKCPENKVKNLRFTFNLVNEDGKDEFNGTKLNRFAMQEIVDDIAFFSFRPPQAATYLMVIYAKDMENKTKEGVYGGVCEYKIVSEKDPEKPNPFPPCVHTTWGPGDSAAKFNMTPLQSGSVVQAVNGVAEVRFGVKSKLRFVTKLKSNDKDDKSLAPYVFYRPVENDVVFRVAAPTAGEYGLEIYANNPEQGGSTLQHAYQYLILCPETRPGADGVVEPFPTLTAGYLGPQASFETFGLSIDSHPDPYVETDQGDIQISFKMTRPLRVTSQLLFVSGGQNIDSSEYVLQQGSDRGVTFVLNLHRTGLFKFQIFATLTTETGDSLPGVFNFLINCSSTVCSQAAFPKQFGPWKSGCYLYEPLEGHLQPNRSSKGSASTYQHVYFKLDIPHASAVSVVIGKEWVKLVKSEPCTWEGEAQMDKHWETERKALVCGNFGTTANSFSTLLEYSM